jgi:hypothetical protein
MPTANVIQLRAILSEKFPGLRTQLNDPSIASQLWATGLRQIDEPLHGGLPKGALTEVVAGEGCFGSASLIRALLAQAAQEKQIIALIDGNDSLDVVQLEQNILSQLLWVRARSAEQALKAADLILRDSNVSLVLLDLAANPLGQARQIPATTWYRLQRLIKDTKTVAIIFTPRALVSPAQVRLTLHSQFSLDALEQDLPQLLEELKLEVSDHRQVREEIRRQSA